MCSHTACMTCNSGDLAEHSWTYRTVVLSRHLNLDHLNFHRQGSLLLRGSASYTAAQEFPIDQMGPFLFLNVGAHTECMRCGIGTG
mmetsp:Transcript_152/g.288  ORF Transcript_152/g.288 Transcript_152/m.288 type:complete len:86 (+) Transcript_152:174-431(+)